MRHKFTAAILIALTAGAVLGRVIASPVSAATDHASKTSLLYTAAKLYNPLAWMRGGERFPQGAQIIVNNEGAAHSLTTGFFATADPEVAFDGKAILFAGKKTATSPWQIWELSAGAETPRQVVSTAEDAIRPLYLPEDRIVYARKRDGRFVIESAPLQGGQSVSLTFVPGSAVPTTVLQDGRILFEAAYPLGAGSAPEIYTVYPDGSGVESYRCDHVATRYSGRQLSSGDIVFTHGHDLAKFTSPLAHEVALSAPKGEYAGDVAETPSGELVLAWRPDAARNFELKAWKPGSPSLASIVAQAGMNLVQPVVNAARPIPNRYPSALHEWKTANLMALNAYTSRYALAKGSIASVRVYGKVGSAAPSVLGTAPVEQDGSFYIRVPGDTPLRFELLDSKGTVLKKQSAWVWARAGEQRVCVGCHTGPERAPDNAVPAILERSTEPADLTGAERKSQKGGN